MTREQQRLLNSACDDLAAQVRWHGFRLTRDDFRHLIAGTVLGWRTLLPHGDWVLVREVLGDDHE